MNRNVLKIIALVSMLIDHIGWILIPAPATHIFRAIGRIAMPIYAFFVAQGYFYTRSKKRYMLTLLFWSVISQIPYVFISGPLHFNFMFALFLSTLCILAIENFKQHKFWYSLIIVLIVAFANPFFPPTIDYSCFGILLVLAFYFIKDKSLSFLVASVLLVGIGIQHCISSASDGMYVLAWFASLLALVLLYFYNGKKGKLNLKYLFYAFYPLHLTILYILKLIIFA